MSDSRNITVGGVRLTDQQLVDWSDLKIENETAVILFTNLQNQKANIQENIVKLLSS